MSSRGQYLAASSCCFASIRLDTSRRTLIAGCQIHYDGDSWNEPGTNLYGCLKAIYLLKKQNRCVFARMCVSVSRTDWTRRVVAKRVAASRDHPTVLLSCARRYKPRG
jgi:hypothetical protein